MCVCPCSDTFGCVTDQPVYAHLISPGTVQEGDKGVAAVMGRVICMYTYGGQCAFKQLYVCRGADRAAIYGK